MTNNVQLVVFAAFIVFSVGAAVIKARANRNYERSIRRNGRTRCGGCGYELGTLQGGRCPECGADLMDVGVVGAGRSRR